MPEPRLELQTIKVKQLVADYRTGRIVIPELQREYVWKKSRAPQLIDSLYRASQYPRCYFGTALRKRDRVAGNLALCVQP